MVSCKLCGPKQSVCWMILSVWGVIMLGLLGVFFRVRSPALAEDLPIDNGEWANTGYSSDYYIQKYNQASTNCFIAAGLYVAVFGFSFFQFRVNVRANYVTK